MAQNSCIETIGDFPVDDAASRRFLVTLADASMCEWWKPLEAGAGTVDTAFGELLRGMAKVMSAKGNEEVPAALAYATNELMDNAIKFNQGGAIDLTIGLGNSGIFCIVCNQVAIESLADLRSKFQQLILQDAGELLRKQLETEFSSGDSGIGYLTLIHDYDARLSWKIIYCSDSLARLLTCAYLPTDKG